jgi:S-adenosylmethionine hydrolase
MTSIHREMFDKPEIKGDVVVGSIIYADKFGNLITNIPTANLERIISDLANATISVLLDCPYKEDKIGPKPEIHEMEYRKTYGSAQKGELLILSGSLGLIELAVREGSAADRLQVRPGDRLTLSRKHTGN